jgi:hypothetical protein
MVGSGKPPQVVEKIHGWQAGQVLQRKCACLNRLIVKDPNVTIQDLLTSKHRRLG